MALTPDIDLPLDILTEILSYLSLKTLLKTCTLNRLFLDLSLDFLYQEIYLDSTDPGINQTFYSIIPDQLVASRVRRIYIFSYFSAPAEPRCSLLTRDPTQFQEKFNNTLIRLEKLRRLFNRKGIPPPDSPTNETSTAGLDSVPNTPDLLLPSLRELTITFVKSCKGIDQSMALLSVLWETHRIGESLRRLSVTTGTFNSLMLLLPTVRYLYRMVSNGNNDDKGAASYNVQAFRNPRFCSITHLSIHYIPEFDRCTDPILVHKCLSQLFEPLASTLSSLTLYFASYPCADIRRVQLFEQTNPKQHDFSGILEGLPHLPALKEVKFHAPFTPKTMKNPGALTEWLRAYQEQLEQLTIRATSLVDHAPDDSDDSSASEFNTGDYGPGARYANWLTTVGESGYRGFFSLNFASLHSLEIRTGRPLMHDRQRVLPPLKRIVPSLKSLTLGYDDWLDQSEVENVLQDLPTLPEGCRGLETLRLRYIQLSPELLDLLHEKLPRLKVLVLDCKRKMWVRNLYGLLNRKYTWQLSRLRITTSSRVRRSTTTGHLHFHPHLQHMRMVADCLEGDPVLDMEFTCGCE